MHTRSPLSWGVERRQATTPDFPLFSMRFGAILIAVFPWACTSGNPVPEATPVPESAADSTPQTIRGVELRLASGFWSNLHQFLFTVASARAGNGPIDRVTVQAAQNDAAAVELMPDPERRAWNAAIEFYMDSLAREPAWNEPALVNEALWKAGSAEELPAPGIPSAVHRTLTEAAAAYRRAWWDDHARRNA